MKYLKFLFLFFILFASKNAHANIYNVSFNTLHIPIGVQEQYIEVHAWYPTTGRVLLRTIEREGKQFALARNAKPIEDELNLIVISTPSFTNSFDYASLAYSFARRGFVVAVITHIDDNKERMFYTMSGWQMVWRAAQIKEVIEYFKDDSLFNINKDNISSISIAETALAPLLLDNFVLDTTSYEKFCIEAREDAFCQAPYDAQVRNIITSTNAYAIESQERLVKFQAESDKVRKENTHLQTEWDKATQRAMRYSEELPDEPTWQELPHMPIEADLNAPYIKNYFFIEPLLTFLIQSSGHSAREDIEILSINSKNPAIPDTSMHSNYLHRIFLNNFTDLNIEKYNHLDLLDRNKKQNNLNNLQQPDLLLKISEREQSIFIESFVKNITENILNF